eukprot:CAMPEP_0197845526 /NCGR_PEP_ID=MMETSP1438-20131217/2446_1 /TAXON_ID=1461541 /ORGANISM="Pterosperma sp., Strain CCMP1384" /LENGTH=324 /DNA_ID=CAMNT_0043456853 /DNA_START=138 /DNA_END=1112 /DNA_ORIENTATION=+
MASIVKSSVIVVNVKSEKRGTEPAVAARLKSYVQPKRGVATAAKPSSPLAHTNRAKVAAQFNKRVEAVQLSRSQLEVAKREKLEKLDERLSAAEEKRVTVVSQIATRASKQNVKVNERQAVVKAQMELRATELSERLSNTIQSASENRQKKLDAVRARASLNGAGQPHSQVVESVQKVAHEKKAELEANLSNKLDAAHKKHDEHLETIRNKAATINSRVASVQEAQSSSQALMMDKIKDSLVAADAKRQEVIDVVRSKASAVVERHNEVVMKHKKLSELQAKTAMLKIEVKLQAAENRRESLSPNKGLSPRKRSSTAPIPFSIA